jgi:hypothetical protein
LTKAFQSRGSLVAKTELSGALLKHASFALDESAPDHSAIFNEPGLMDFEQHGCSGAGSTTRVNMLAPFFG